MNVAAATSMGTSFSRLLARYIDGQIGERAWKKIMHTFDMENISTLERMAYARFMNEMIAESNGKKFDIPAPEEVSVTLGDVRTSA